MTETGQPFEVVSVDRPGERYTVEPVPVYGRAAAGRRFVTASWSTWSYRLKDRPEVAAFPVGATTGGRRPERFLLDFGDEAPGSVDVRLADA